MPDVKLSDVHGGERAVPESRLRDFGSALQGETLLPGDAGYDDARHVWNGMIDKHPGVIARCASARDVAAAIRFAREHDLLLSVKGGGHNIAGKAVCEGGLTIDLSPLRAVEVDAERRVVRVGGGALLGDLDRAAQAHGLATTAGVVSHTGVGGLTLGGGVGRLARKHRLACDNVLRYELVTADGEIVTASDDEEPDLAWALRGGGGNFGVVTGFTFRLHPVGPMVTGGVIIHPLARAADALAFCRDYAPQAPRDLAVDAILLGTPDGQKVLAFSVCFIGDPGRADEVLGPLRRFGDPIDQVEVMPFVDVQASADVFFPPGERFYWKSHLLREVPDDLIAIGIEHFAKAPSPRSLLVFQQYGGAVSDVGPTETAFWHRDAVWDHFPTAVWSDPSETEANIAWVREWWDATRSFSKGGEYVNNLGEEGEEHVRSAYGGNYDRLRDIKRRYDPDNVFRLNANVRP